MDNRLPPLGWLRSFEAAARHLSFTAAARDLNMTQSAVSQQIKSLEGHLGRALFHRRPRALELTEAGKTYVPVVRDAFAMLANGTRAVAGDRGRSLHIHANMTFATQWLAPRLPRFRELHPDVPLTISAEIWEPTGPTEGIDVEIRFTLRKPEGANVRFLRRDEIYPVCAPEYSVTLETLPQAPLYDCANLLSNWQFWAEQQSLIWSKPKVTYASTYTFCLELVQAGGGVMLGHDMICARLLDEGRLIRPATGSVEMAEAYYLILSDQAADIPGAEAFADWLLAEMSADQSGRDGTQA